VIEVARVFTGGAADKAGLHRGDVITKIDGKTLTGMEYPNSLLTGSPDTDVVVTVRRKDSEKDYTLHRQRASMAFRRTLSPRRGGGYRQVVYRTDVSGLPKAGSDAVPVGR
jgi:C-terminal processing protease CtpA/Prc